MTQKITPCLWFDDQAKEAAEFYISVFGDGRIVSAGPTVVEWEVHGMRFTGINGGPRFQFSEAVSFQIDCADQAEVDAFWEKLLAGGGEESMCGWLRDRYGLSWQVIPRGLGELLGGPDAEAAERARQAMFGMRRLDIAGLRAAYAGDAPA